MVGVHHDRHPRHLGRQAAERSGLGGVRVDDVRPHGPHQAEQLPEHDRVGRPAHLPAERGEDRQTRRVGPVEPGIVPLARLLRPGDEARVVAARIEPLGQQCRVQRRSADVETGNDPQDPHPL